MTCKKLRVLVFYGGDNATNPPDSLLAVRVASVRLTGRRRPSMREPAVPQPGTMIDSVHWTIDRAFEHLEAVSD